jgi:hypothetical protein
MSQRCGLTVVLQNGIRLDAIMVTPTTEDFTGRPMLSFICSGKMISKPVGEIRAVEFYPGPQTFCGMCEGPLPVPVKANIPVVVGP